MARPQPLPIDQLLPRVIEQLQNSPALVLRSPTGSGKTTRIPPALEAAGLGPVILLEPRRLSARAAAARMAQESGQKLGEHFGYRVRFDAKTSPRTRVTAVTEGLFLRQLLSDPFLEGVNCVVFDEFHERHLEGDLCLALVRKIQLELRPELRIVVLSATIETKPLQEFLGATVITSEGKLFPVATQHQPALGREALEDQVLRAATDMCAQTTGDLLVFLPGKAEIRRSERSLARLAAQLDLELHVLHGDLTPAAQDAALCKAKRRKIILSTNLAESSVTVDGVTGVIDSGLARIPRFDAQRGLDKLELVPISMQSVLQRAGRAGRQAEGINLRLWSRLEEGGMAAQADPEVRRVDMASAWLSLLDFGESKPADFGWFEAPESRATARADELLRALGATARAKGNETGQITSLGRELARLPLHPRLGRLLIAGRENGCLQRAALVAAMISERDAVGAVTDRMDPKRVVESDVLERLELLEDYERGRGARDIHRAGARQIFSVRDQLLRSLKAKSKTPDSSGDEALLRAIFVAFADRLARRRSENARSKQKKRTKKVAREARFQATQEQRALLSGGAGARLGRGCHVLEERLFVCVELAAGGAEAEIRQASGVQAEWLDPEGYGESIVCTFDTDKDQAVLMRRKSWNGLMLHENVAQITDSESRRALEGALLQAARSQIEKAFDLEQPNFAQFVARWNCLDEWLPGLELGTLDGERWVQKHLEDLVQGARSFADLKGISLVARIKNAQDYQKVLQLESQAPARFQLPAGRSAAITYAVGKQPVLAARIQHLFGIDSTPSLLAGRIPLLLQLCAPNGRPAQITSDLPGFWSGSYALVRKDLKGRYPKHDWPLDPLSASPKPPRKREPRSK